MRTAFALDEVMAPEALGSQAPLQRSWVHVELVGDGLGAALAGRQQAAGQPDDPLGERGIARKVLGFQIFRGDALGFRIRMVDGPTGEPVVHLEPAPCPAEPNGTTQRFAVGGVGAQLRMSERENSAPMPEALIKIYAAKNIEVVQGYALTESCGGGTLLLSEDALRKAGSAGRATMFTDVAVRGDDGVIREHGEGEVVIKSDILLKEYWNRPEATRDAFDNGWFRTGDIGEIDDEGYLYIKDRLKDMIISGGENVYPAEIESVIIGVPGVSEVAVIGLPDEKWGEIAAAIVVADQNEVSEQQIVEYCGTRLARYKLPKKVIFAEAIPRNPTGKILKTVLREQYSATVPK